MKNKRLNSNQIIVSIIILLSIISLSIILIENNKTEDIDISTNNCPNFNAKSFLLTGGSQHPETMKEISIESSRLVWLCNGAPE